MLESDVKAIREKHQSARREDKAAFLHDLGQVKMQVAGLLRDVAEQLKTSVRTLQERQAQQQLQMQQSLEELKQLMLHPAQLPRKARREDESEL